MLERSLIFILLCLKLWMVESAAAGLLEDAEKSDVSAVRLRLEEEKEKRILLNNDVEVLMLKVARLERQMTQVLQKNQQAWMLESTAACLVEDVEKSDINLRLRLEEEKRILLSKSIDILTLRTEILERQMAQVLQNTQKGSANGGLTEANRSQCPSNYTLHTPLNLCFRLSKESQTWETAVKICESERGHLAKVNTIAIQLYLKEQIKNSLYIPIGSHVFIAGNDRQEEGIWRWADRELIDMKSPLWSSGQPNGGQRENCLILHGGDNFLYVDIACSSAYYYICQIGYTN